MKRRRKTFYDIVKDIKDNTMPRGVPPRNYTTEQKGQAVCFIAKHFTIPQIHKRIRMYREQQIRAFTQKNDEALLDLAVMEAIDIAAANLKMG